MPAPGHVVWLRACGTMEAKIMKYHVLSWSPGKVLAEDRDQAELLYGYSLTKTSENNSKLVHSVTNLHLFYLTCA